MRSRLYRHADVRRLWAGQTISQLGSQVSNLALPLIAVLALESSAFRVSALGAIELLPWLLFALFTKSILSIATVNGDARVAGDGGLAAPAE